MSFITKKEKRRETDREKILNTFSRLCDIENGVCVYCLPQGGGGGRQWFMCTDTHTQQAPPKKAPF